MSDWRQEGGGERLDAPAYHRNIEPILAVLTRGLNRPGPVLEIGSGTGQHIRALAGAFPEHDWWPSDPDPRNLASIQAWRGQQPPVNLHPPVRLDVTEPWDLEVAGRPPSPLQAVLCCNVVHIAPWEVACALFAGAGHHLTATGQLWLYGPYRIDGRHTADSNAAFDIRLRQQNPSWGVRDLEALVELGNAAGLRLAERSAMPANNFTLRFERA